MTERRRIQGAGFRADALLEATQARLTSAGVEEARLKAELLISDVLDVPRLELLHRARLGELPALDGAKLEAGMRRLEQREPLQYVLGHADFHGRRFLVDRRALIPRPETEILVDQVLHAFQSCEAPPQRWADVGTGSGCIAVTLALEGAGRGLAIDSSAEALALARENARRLGADERIDFEQGDLLAGRAEESLDLVVSNPPYIPAGELAQLQPEVRDYEPRAALDGGTDGLRIIERLAEQAFQALKRGGRLLLEVGAGQAPAVQAVLQAARFTRVGSAPDLAGVERIVMGTKTS